MKIFLIGFMGSGKSTLGKELAQLLSLRFVDLDELITVKEGKPVTEIFATSGEEHFRNIEKEMLTDQLTEDDFIMATGGGTPCFFRNINLMNESGITVYLQLSPSSLFERLKDETEARPLLKVYDMDGLLDFIKSKLTEREKWYLQSKLVITEQEQDPQTIAAKIKAYMPEGGFSS